MELLNEITLYIIEALGPNGPLIVIGLLGVFLILVALPIVMVKPADPFDRLEGAGSFHDSASLSAKSDLRQKQTGPNLDRFAAYLEPQDQKEYSKRRLKLVQAGYRSKDTVRSFHFIQMVAGVIGLVGGALYTFLFSDNADVVTLLLKIIVPGIVGYYLPSYWVERRRQVRQQELLESFPDALDLMLICVESGQTLDHTMLRVARELETAYPTLSEELTIISNETRAGKDRPTVLKDFAERCDVNDIKAFVTVLIQSAKFGTPISEALRVFSAEMRDKRVMRAEEKANVLPTKMTLCTMMFTVPPLLVLLVGPSVYDIFRYMTAGNN